MAPNESWRTWDACSECRLSFDSRDFFKTGKLNSDPGDIVEPHRLSWATSHQLDPAHKNVSPYYTPDYWLMIILIDWNDGFLFQNLDFQNYKPVLARSWTEEEKEESDQRRWREQLPQLPEQPRGCVWTVPGGRGQGDPHGDLQL